MANRNVTAFRQVTDIARPSGGQELQAVANIAMSLSNAASEAKINKNLSQAQLELNAYTRQFQIDNQADPMANKLDYDQGRQDILDKYGEEINPLHKNKWLTASRDLVARNDLSMQSWQFKQETQNAITDINDTMALNFQQSNINGQEYGKGEITELESIINFQDGYNRLLELGAKTVGEQSAKEQLKDYDKDSIKSFLTGVSSTNPEKAKELMLDDSITEKMTSDEKLEIENIIKKDEKRHSLAISYKQDANEQQILDSLNDVGKDYYTMRLNIDRAEISGDISTRFATQARRVLNSQKEVDAVTNNDVMAEIVTQMYDLNAIKEVSNDDYLVGLQNIKTKILQKQADGKLSRHDVLKLNNQMKTLTSQKVAQATNEIAYNFGRASEIFEQLPPEMRGQATRELFYATEGQDLSSPEYVIRAASIVDNINNVRRNTTLKKVKQLLVKEELPKEKEEKKMESVDELLGRFGYTNDDVKETALKYGMTEEQVIEKLRAKK